MMRLHWLLPHPSMRNFSSNELERHNLASVRLRAGPFSWCLDKGSATYQVSFGEVIESGGLDVLIIGKIGADNSTGRFEKWSSIITKTSLSGGKVILDFTDDHLGSKTQMTTFYEWAVHRADAFVASSEHLLQRILSVRELPGKIIEDAVEFSVRAPKMGLTNPEPTLFWFGHSTNINSLANGLNAIYCDKKFRLHVMTNDVGLQLLRASSVSWDKFINPIATTWSVGGLERVASECDLVFIPTASESRKKGVSTNRLITSLTLGLPTFAGDFDSYRKFKDYFSPVEDLSSKETERLISEGYQKVIKAQKTICQDYTFDKIGRIWMDCLLE